MRISDWSSDVCSSDLAAYAAVANWLQTTPHDELLQRQSAAEGIFRKLGITFSVYDDENAEERIIPFDIVPRIISGAEWALIEKGLKQRVSALNDFLRDVYGKREILKAGIGPDGLVLYNTQFHLPITSLKPPHGLW